MSAAATVAVMPAFKNARRSELKGEYFPIPMRPLLRMCFQILAVQSEYPGASKHDPCRGENAVRGVVEDILETYVRDEFLTRVGTSPAEAEQFIQKRMSEGMSEEKAIRHLLKVMHTEDAQ